MIEFIIFCLVVVIAGLTLAVHYLIKSVNNTVITAYKHERRIRELENELQLIKGNLKAKGGA